MKKEKALQIFGWTQLIFSILLGAATVSAYVTYRASVGDVSRSLAASILSLSDVISQVSHTLKVRQDLIDATRETILSSRKLVVEMQASAEAQGKLLPQYASNLMNSAALAADLGKKAIAAGDLMQVSIPTGIRREGLKPALTRSQPFAVQGDAVKAHGENIMEMSNRLTAIANSLSNNVPKLNAAFSETCRQTIKLLDTMAMTTEKLSLQELPKAISALEAASQHLRQASERATGVEWLAGILLIIGIAFAGLGASGGVASLLIAQLGARDTAAVG